MKGLESAAVDGVLPGLGRNGASLFAACAVERLRPILAHVPSGSAPLVAGVALTQLWRVLEGAQRPDPRQLSEVSQACWALVDIEPAPKVPAALLELLVAATHHAVQTYLSGNPQQALQAAAKIAAAFALEPAQPGPAAELERQARDARELAELLRSGSPLGAAGTRLRERAEEEGKACVATLLRG